MSSEFLQRLTYFLMIIPLISFHEAAHALAAHLLGDDTPKEQGRLTLNPISHIDPIGTLLIPGINLFIGGFGLIGWGRPVMVDSRNFSNWRRDEVLVSLAGPFSNIVLAVGVLFLCRWLPETNSLRSLGAEFALVSVFLGVFNMIPIPQLDGWRPIQHLFRIPHEFTYRGGFWWYLLLLVLINCPPFMRLISVISFFIFNILARITLF